jgi:hypothetical protein
MKAITLLALALCFAASSAFAETQFTLLQCKTDKGLTGKAAPTKFKMIVARLDGGKLDFEYLSPDDENNGTIVRVISPKSSRVGTLNDNTGWGRVRDGIEISGDGDGCDTVTLKLYKKTNYTRGYFRASGSSGCMGKTPYLNEYVTVTCSRQEYR